MAYKKKERAKTVPSSVPSYLAELGTRIDTAATSLGSRKNAASAMGVSTDQLARYLRGENEPPVGAVARLGKASGYSVTWLVAGEGPMLLSELLGDALQDFVDVENLKKTSDPYKQAQQDERPRLTKLEIESINNEVFGGSPARFPKNEQFEAMLKRVADASQATVRVSKEFDFALPVEWTSLIQELMALHGLTESGAKRVIEELKRQA